MWEQEFNQLQKALNCAQGRRASIKRESYSYTEEVLHVKRHRIAGIRVVKHRWSEKVVRYREGDYQRDIRSADIEVSNASASLNSFISVTESNLRKDIANLQTALSSARAIQSSKQQELSKLQSELVSKTQSLAQLNKEVESKQQELLALDVSYKETGTKIKELEQAVEHDKQETEDLLSGISDQERAFLFTKLVGEVESDDLIEQLVLLGIDWGYVANEAIVNNREDLLANAITHGVDFDQKMVQGYSLIEQAIRYKSPLLDQMLAVTKDLSNSLAHIIETDNVKALERLVTSPEFCADIDISSITIEGRNLLDFAVLKESKKVKKYLENHYPKLIECSDILEQAAADLAMVDDVSEDPSKKVLAWLNKNEGISVQQFKEDYKPDSLTQMSDRERTFLFMEPANQSNDALIDQLVLLGIDWDYIANEVLINGRKDLEKTVVVYAIDAPYEATSDLVGNANEYDFADD